MSETIDIDSLSARTEMATHDAVVTVGIRQPLAIQQVPTIKPQVGEVRVRVLWTASTPLDLHQNDGGLLVTHPQVLGDGIGGEVVEVGPEVEKLKVGDQVFGFAWRSNQERAHQIFVTLPDYLLGKKPEGVSFESAVTLPNNFVTTWHTFVTDLGIELPYPKPRDYVPTDANTPILIWGGTTSVGQFALQVLRYYGYNHVATTASSRHHTLLSEFGAQFVADYNNVDVVDQLRKFLGDGSIRVLDCVGSQKGSIEPTARLVKAPGSVVAILLPVIVRDASDTDAPEYSLDVQAAAEWAKDVVVRGVRTHYYLENEFHKQNLQPTIMPELLGQGIIKPNNYRLIEGETLLKRAQNALDALRRKEASGERLVWRVSEK